MESDPGFGAGTAPETDAEFVERMERTKTGPMVNGDEGDELVALREENERLKNFARRLPPAQMTQDEIAKLIPEKVIEAASETFRRAFLLGRKDAMREAIASGVAAWEDAGTLDRRLLVLPLPPPPAGEKE